MEPDASELHQLVELGPGIRLGEQENQIARLLRPDIGRQVAIADRHGVILAVSERRPGHITRMGLRGDSEHHQRGPKRLHDFCFWMKASMLRARTTMGTSPPFTRASSNRRRSNWLPNSVRAWVRRRLSSLCPTL